MSGVRIQKRYAGYHPNYGYMIVILGTCHVRHRTWKVAYMWLPESTEAVRSLNLDGELEEKFGITFIGEGQQHWLVHAVKLGINELAGHEQCWIGWDWFGQSMIDGEPEDIDSDELLHTASTAYEYITKTLRGQHVLNQDGSDVRIQ